MIDGGEHINIVSYGGGANSTALLIGLHQHRIPVDLILFADTGGEHPHTYAYPLMEWGWDREACIRAIEAAGLPQPGKSSCFFCPSMRAEEIIDLREHYWRMTAIKSK